MPIPHKLITPILFKHSIIFIPSYEIFFMARLKCVNGKNLHNVCIQEGKTSIGKKVPDNSI